MPVDRRPVNETVWRSDVMNNPMGMRFPPAFPVPPVFVAASAAVVLALGCHAQVTYTAQLRSVYAEASAADPLGIDPPQGLQDSASAPDYGAYSKTFSLTAASGVAAVTASASVDSTALGPAGFAATGSAAVSSSGGYRGLGDAWLQAVFTVQNPMSYTLTGSLSASPQGTLSYVQLFYIDWSQSTSTYLHDFTAAGPFEGSGVLLPGYEYYVYAYSSSAAGNYWGVPYLDSNGSFDVTFVVPEPPQYAVLAALGLGGWGLWRRWRSPR